MIFIGMKIVLLPFLLNDRIVGNLRAGADAGSGAGTSYYLSV